MSWFLMVAFGFATMFAMRFTPDKVDAILIRVAALSFAGAGAIGATGWLGELINKLMGWLVALVDKFSYQVLGTPVAWIMAAGLGALWVGALLPAKWFSFDFPDSLIFNGFFLPGLLASVPGGAGQVLRTIVLTCGELLNNLVGSWF